MMLLLGTDSQPLNSLELPAPQHDNQPQGDDEPVLNNTAWIAQEHCWW